MMTSEKRQIRSRKKAKLQRLAAWYRNNMNRLRKVYARNVPVPESRRAAEQERQQLQALLNRMTNWQRNKLFTATKGKTPSLGMAQDYAAMSRRTA